MRLLVSRFIRAGLYSKLFGGTKVDFVFIVQAISRLPAVTPSYHFSVRRVPNSRIPRGTHVVVCERMIILNHISRAVVRYLIVVIQAFPILLRLLLH